MQIYDTYVGNRSAEDVTERLADSTVETVTVDDDQRRRSRFRATTDEGTEVGVVVGRELRAGDVLSTGDGESLVEVALEPVEALVVDLTDAEGDLATAVALGHATGNRHWDMAVRGAEVLFPATESDDRMRETVNPHLPDGATLQREAVSPATFDGGAVGHGSDGHSHDHAHAHSHDHTGHSHGHDSGKDHVTVSDLRSAAEEGEDS